MPRKYTNKTTHFILHDDGTFDVYMNKKFKECGLYEETPDSVLLNYFKHSSLFLKEEGCLISENYRIWIEDGIINVPGGILNNGVFIANRDEGIANCDEGIANCDEGSTILKD